MAPVDQVLSPVQPYTTPAGSRISWLSGHAGSLCEDAESAPPKTPSMSRSVLITRPKVSRSVVPPIYDDEAAGTVRDELQNTTGDPKGSVQTRLGRSGARTRPRTPAIILSRGLPWPRAAATSRSWRLGFALLPPLFDIVLVGERASQQPL